MNKEESLLFVQERLRQQHASPLQRQLHLRPRERVLRRIAMEIDGGSTHALDCVDGSVMVRCASGSLWITHDGDPKDVILGADESYRAESERTMHLSALQPCVVEIEFEDEVMAQ
ncbi:MAG: hypothetical protein JWQ76_2051 [Ramlibacter sp.]|nr:hypothetical protein [Ramlibacter sp.]